jgi:hypothetical protein
MYVGSWKLGANLTFYCNTHDPSTGAATDADSVPSYRVYEDETTSPLLTGTMALIDGSNTAGFYSEQITVSTGNGFEQGKSYAVYISATVGGVTATLHRYFQIGADVSLTWILGTLLTETAGQLAGGFKKWFDVSSPVGTVNSIPNATAGAASGLALVGSNMGSVTTVTDISTTAQAEPVAVPAASVAPLTKIGWIYAVSRNKITETINTQLVRNDTDSATIGTATCSDDGVTAIRGKFS